MDYQTLIGLVDTAEVEDPLRRDMIAIQDYLLDYRTESVDEVCQLIAEAGLPVVIRNGLIAPICGKLYTHYDLATRTTQLLWEGRQSALDAYRLLRQRGRSTPMNMGESFYDPTTIPDSAMGQMAGYENYAREPASIPAGHAEPERAGEPSSSVDLNGPRRVRVRGSSEKWG